MGVESLTDEKLLKLIEDFCAQYERKLADLRTANRALDSRAMIEAASIRAQKFVEEIMLHGQAATAAHTELERRLESDCLTINRSRVAATVRRVLGLTKAGLDETGRIRSALKDL